jgi:choline dehydrogenase-like flavoprotein
MSAQFDAIIIGSGMSGGWVAKELTERGLKVLVLERGRDIDPATDFSDMKNPWELPYGNQVPEEEAKRDYYVQSKFGGFQGANKTLWAKDSDAPYVQPKDKPFNWVRSHQVGGRSLIWGRQAYRLSDLDFEANKKDGVAVDWPIRYADLEKWYDHVERFAGISGSKEGIPQLPDGQFIKPMGLNCVEEEFAKGVAEKFGGRRIIPGRTANLSEVSKEQADLGRGACQYRSYCIRGCSFGASFSSINATLPAAKRTGNMTLMPDSIVHSIVTDPKSGKATGVKVIDAKSMKATLYTGRMIFLNASAIASAQILLNSATDTSPNGLANSSEQVGRNLMDHIFGITVQATVPGHLDKTVFGRRPNGIYIPRYRNIGSDRQDFIRGFGYQGGIGRVGWEVASGKPGIGGAWKDALAQQGEWRAGISGFGEMLPYADNRVTLHKSAKDKWGIPQPEINCVIGENERKMSAKIAEDAQEMFEAMGYDVFHVNAKPADPGTGIHEMGTLRMGRDPRTSVLNQWNQTHDIPNLFCTDGGAMTSSACQNPSLTYMALSARAADYAVQQLKDGQL